MKILAVLLMSALSLGIVGCKTLPISSDGVVQDVRERLDALPEPTFATIEVYTHDLAALGTTKLVAKYPEAKVPLRILSDSALSILTTETVSMMDVIALSNSLDEIKEGEVKKYLDIAWTLLELNGVIRRDDLTAVLTVREQRLLVALFKGIKLGTGPAEETTRLLNSVGPRY